MLKIKLWVLAVRIEVRWWFILRYRKIGSWLLDRDEPLTSKRLLWLSKRIDHHGIKAFAYEDRYRKMIGE